jgi:hypothetical protein
MMQFMNKKTIAIAEMNTVDAVAHLPESYQQIAHRLVERFSDDSRLLSNALDMVNEIAFEYSELPREILLIIALMIECSPIEQVVSRLEGILRNMEMSALMGDEYCLCWDIPQVPEGEDNDRVIEDSEIFRRYSDSIVHPAIFQNPLVTTRILS